MLIEIQLHLRDVVKRGLTIPKLEEDRRLRRMAFRDRFVSTWSSADEWLEDKGRSVTVRTVYWRKCLLDSSIIDTILYYLLRLSIVFNDYSGAKKDNIWMWNFMRSPFMMKIDSTWMQMMTKGGLDDVGENDVNLILMLSLMYIGQYALCYGVLWQSFEVTPHRSVTFKK